MRFPAAILLVLVVGILVRCYRHAGTSAESQAEQFHAGITR